MGAHRGHQLAWSGQNLALARRIDAESVFTGTWFGETLKATLPELWTLCSRRGWTLFSVTYVHGRDAWAWRYESSRMHRVLGWAFEKLGGVVELVSIDLHHEAGPERCLVAPVPYRCLGKRTCVVSMDPVAYARRWDELQRTKPHDVHVAFAPEEECIAVSVNELADDTLLYVRSGASLRWLLGAVNPALGWRALVRAMGEACQVYGVRFVDETDSKLVVTFDGRYEGELPPFYTHQRIIAVASAKLSAPASGGPPSSREGSGERADERASVTTRCGDMRPGGEGPGRRRRRRLAQRLLCWRTRILGPLAAYLIDTAEGLEDVVLKDEFYGPTRLRTEPAWAGRFRCTVWGTALAALGYLVAGVATRRLPWFYLGGYASAELPVAAAFYGHGTDDAIVHRHHATKQKVMWTFATRDLRWAPELASIALRHPVRARIWYRRPRFANFVAKSLRRHACFIVEHEALARFLDYRRLRLLSRCLLLPDGLPRILSRRVLAVAGSGIVVVREALSSRFEEAVRAVAAAVGAHLEWVEVPEIDRLVRPLRFPRPR